ncbi:MAG: zf-TFIIB domain-containing protein [Planctomycetota bacterium]
MHLYRSKAEGIAYGRLLLIRCTCEDHGYDLKAWHDLLANQKNYAPGSREKPGKYSNMILLALEDAEWTEAVQIAESERLLEKITAKHQQIRDEMLRAEREWSGQERQCPKCETTFVSVQNRGQCPRCGFVFLASNPDGKPHI